MKRRSVITLLAAFLILLLPLQSVSAFPDTGHDPNAAKIEKLKNKGIVNGAKNGRFNPKGKLSYAEGVSLIVKGMELSLAHIQFIKEPKASDYFTHVPDKAWYAKAFVIAHHNGLDIPKDVKPHSSLSREQFAHLLYQALITTGDYAFTEIYHIIKDENNINPDYMTSIQRLLNIKVIQLDKSGKFYPQKAITRSEAAAWLHDAIDFVKEMAEQPMPEPEPQPQLQNLKLSLTPVNPEVNRVTVTADAPHPGYGIRIASITFDNDTAILHVETVQPDPNQMYPQVITEVKAETYVASSYKVRFAS
ncbi:S-layer protein [Paenibacillus sp. 32O-W]|uniref:S-layer homology domain-containing protein n=1 Tax=Paenibacillus sp. 32O-W TaxID=1695218 RepID=UPI000721A6C5|nr:S-layer homology domain-containing protein [Paenibacillus sp. 32O-W]ALS27404.1 S-layer protein [Paenibacillus sp. 32O-W]